MNGDTKVIVSPSVLENWGRRMDQINTACLDVISKYVDNVNSLENGWLGVSANSYEQNCVNYMNTAIACHEKMKDVNTFLAEVVNTISNE